MKPRAMALEQRARRDGTERQCGSSTAAENKSKVTIKTKKMRMTKGATHGRRELKSCSNPVLLLLATAGAAPALLARRSGTIDIGMHVP